jgi:hypothetical protein
MVYGTPSSHKPEEDPVTTLQKNTRSGSSAVGEGEIFAVFCLQVNAFGHAFCAQHGRT